MSRFEDSTGRDSRGGRVTVILMTRLFWSSCLVGTCLLFDVARAAGSPDSPAAARLEFNRDIRPILSENCFQCHGPDKNKRKGKLRLDVRDAAIEKGAIVPGKPQESKLVASIFSTDDDDVMPPPETHKSLTPAQKEMLRQWIAAGAEYQPHWAYLQPRRSDPPTTSNPSWVRNPIDAFVLHTLETKGIKPSPATDRRTLLRRLSLDLTGLPPTPEEVQAFLHDSRDKAYERQVDRLLGSPHFGERMAVPWLDLVRFADTVGYHGDQNQNVFPYRDYVIDSFNRNKPFDQFTIEQIAGDLLPDPTVEQQVATGFNRLNMMTREGGAQPKEYLAKYAADRVRTVSTTWLGSTMGCCECHDHKYDPFTARDFYSMAAFFADIKQWGVYSDYIYTPNPDLKGWSNDHPFPPEIEAESPYLKRRVVALDRKERETCEIATAALRQNKMQLSRYREWRKEAQTFLQRHPDGWWTPSRANVTTKVDTNWVDATNATWVPDGSVTFSGTNAAEDRLEFRLPAGWLAAVRLELVPRGQKEPSILRGDRKNATVEMRAALLAGGGDANALTIAFADANLKEPRYANGAEIPGIQNGWKTARTHRGELHSSVWLLDRPRQVKTGDTLVLTFKNNAAAQIRISLSPFAIEPARWTQEISGLASSLRGNKLLQPPLAGDLFHRSTGWNDDTLKELRRIDRERRLYRDGRAWTLVTVSTNAPVMRVLARGNWQDESGDVVTPAPPRFLSPSESPDGSRLTRLDLARWLVSRQNPLTARVFVNRLWKQFFGTGISAVVDDLGAQGEWPVHPELLDWLACEFMDSGWDVKHMVRLMVTSSTYCQDSNQRPDLKDIDPNNRLLAAQSPRRLEAEFVRDNALTIAGLLNPELGGPSAHPYQPAGYYANLQFPDRDYQADTDEGQYRRGVYAHWQRTFLQPMLANFDAPSREECTANRTVSNTPQQALTLLNDPTFVEAARVFAERVIESGKKSDDDRLDFAFQRALARPATVEEKKSLEKFLASQREQVRSNADDTDKLFRVGLAPVPKGMDRSDLAAWISVCRVILNLNETITRY